MKKIFFNWLKNVQREVKNNPIVYLALSMILVGAFFVRVYRIDQMLGFYFDQGRDAKVIWDFWHNGRLFLIGPTTGIEGIFRGPWYYWLIAPAYLLGNGNPVWPSVFLSLITVVAIFFAFLVGREILDWRAGFLSACIAAFSFQLVQASRWLSNPTPMLLISMLLVYFLFLVVRGRKWAWVVVGFLLGQAMQFGSAAEIFYFPAVALTALWQRKNLPSLKLLIIIGGVFILSFIPQIIFDIRWKGVLSNAVYKFLFDENSFKISFWEVVKMRLPFYFDLFASIVFLGYQKYQILFVLIAFSAFLIHYKELIKNQRFILLALLFISPLIGMLFFRGNYGNVYGYYFTGYYLIFVVLFATLLALTLRHWWGWLITLSFLWFFISINGEIVKGYLSSGTDGPNTIVLGNQKQAVDWVYQDAGSVPFNVDVYVPPVIPHAYDYLFLWWGTTRYNKIPATENLSLLYTVYEQDPPHPERLSAWLTRQETIGIVEKEVRFGGITAQRRMRTTQQ